MVKQIAKENMKIRKKNACLMKHKHCHTWTSCFLVILIFFLLNHQEIKTADNYRSPPPKKTKTQNQEKHISWKKGAAILETRGLLISLYSLHSFISSWNTETVTDEENYKTASKLQNSIQTKRKSIFIEEKGAPVLERADILYSLFPASSSVFMEYRKG